MAKKLKMGVSFRGDTHKMKRYVAKVAREAGMKAAREFLLELGGSFLFRLQEAILRQDLDLAALSKPYVEFKKRADLDPRTLIATGEYVESIEIQERMRGENYMVVVTVPDREHETSGVNLQLLARVLEYGSVKNNIPPRPHWRAIKEMFLLQEDMISRRAEEKIAREVREAIKRGRVEAAYRKASEQWKELNPAEEARLHGVAESFRSGRI